MNMFSKAKDMYALQKQAKQIKDQLANIHIEATEGGVVVTISGEQECVSVKIDMEKYIQNTSQLEKDLTIAINKGVKKSQTIAAEKMKGVMGGLGLA